MTNSPPTTHRVTEFYQWFKGGILELNPFYQRNPVWSDRNKSYLMDTILNNYPVPEIFMQIETTSDGKTKYSVVDGQQRIRSIIEFIDGEYAILESESKIFGGKEFKNLPDGIKKEFWDYSVVTRELQTISDDEVTSVFKRMNKYVVPLNPQELRHATYRGQFIELINELTNDDYWADNKVVSPNDIRRMVDSEFISELIIAMLHCIQTKKTELIDGYYKMYDEVFLEKDNIKKEFLAVRNKLDEILGDLRPVRWHNKPEFYSLFLAFHELMKEYTIPSTRYDNIAKSLCTFSSDIDNAYHSDDSGRSNPNSQIPDFVESVAYHTTDKEARMKRTKIIREIVIPHLIARDPTRDFTEEERRIAWALSKDKICRICSKKVDSWDDYHLDHKIAHNNGGKTELLNSQITHKKCNQEKSKK